MGAGRAPTRGRGFEWWEAYGQRLLLTPHHVYCARPATSSPGAALACARCVRSVFFHGTTRIGLAQHSQGRHVRGSATLASRMSTLLGTVGTSIRSGGSTASRSAHRWRAGRPGSGSAHTICQTHVCLARRSRIPTPAARENSGCLIARQHAIAVAPRARRHHHQVSTRMASS
jgi:hypothetical protein